MKKPSEFYRGKRVFVTGHTGFKGSWLCSMLLGLGAEVAGYALEPERATNSFELMKLPSRMHSVIGDVRDGEKLSAAVKDFKPDIVLHLAAQPLVRLSYRMPAYTYETNVMGTVNILEAVRNCEHVRSFLNVTTDKVYKNREWEYGYREFDELDGFDPYSNSKSCSELVTSGYRNSFFSGADAARISTARAGNVIGGGDFSEDRIIPDCFRAASAGRTIEIRNPGSVRPYQHVLEPLYAYLTIAMAQYDDPTKAGSYNVGPDEGDCRTTRELAELFVKYWSDGANFAVTGNAGGPHEAGLLKLDCAKMKHVFGWKPFRTLDSAVEFTVEWYKAMTRGEDMAKVTDEQIKKYFGAGAL